MDIYTAEQVLLDLDVEDLGSVCQTDKTFHNVCNSSLFWRQIYLRDGLDWIEPPSTYEFYIEDYFDQLEMRSETKFWTNYLYFAYLFTPHDRPPVGLRTQYSPDLIDLGSDHQHIDLHYGLYYENNQAQIGFYIVTDDEQVYPLETEEMMKLISNILVRVYPLIDEDNNDLVDHLEPQLF